MTKFNSLCFYWIAWHPLILKYVDAVLLCVGSPWAVLLFNVAWRKRGCGFVRYFVLNLKNCLCLGCPVHVWWAVVDQPVCVRKILNVVWYQWIIVLYLISRLGIFYCLENWSTCINGLMGIKRRQLMYRRKRGHSKALYPWARCWKIPLAINNGISLISL